LADKGGRCVGLKTLTFPCAECLEILEPQPPVALRACPGLQLDCFNFTAVSKDNMKIYAPRTD